MDGDPAEESCRRPRPSRIRHRRLRTAILRLPFKLIFAVLLRRNRLLAADSNCGTDSRSAIAPQNLVYQPAETADVRIWLERYINSAERTEIVEQQKG